MLGGRTGREEPRSGRGLAWAGSVLAGNPVHTQLSVEASDFLMFYWFGGLIRF